MASDSGTNWPGEPQDEDRWSDTNLPSDRSDPAGRAYRVHEPPNKVARQIVKAIVIAVLGLVFLIVFGVVALYITCSGQSSW